MLGKLLFFLIEFVSLGLFWLIAILCCFWGTETGFKFWFRRLFIGTPFFAFFCYVVLAHGVPRYYVYDHVPAKNYQKEAYLPAVKNHLIFQGAGFKTYGIIKQDLTNFESGDNLFLSFGIQPIEDYPSVNSLTRFTNEIALFVLILSWFFVINKLHNGSVASSLYKKAQKSPSLESYNSYLYASKPIRFLQPIKRRKALKERAKIRQIYTAFLVTLINDLKSHLPPSTTRCLEFLQSKITAKIDDAPSLYVTINLHDIYGQKEKFDEGNFGNKYIYPTEFYLPTATELGDDLSESLVTFFNDFLPEKFMQVSKVRTDIELTCNLDYQFGALIQYGEKKKEKETYTPSTNISGSAIVQSVNSVLPFEGETFTYSRRIFEGKPERSRAQCSKMLAQEVVNQILLKNSSSASANAQKTNKADFENKLEQLNKKKRDLFEVIFKECKSASKEVAVIAAVGVALQKNEEFVDSVMVDMYTLLADNSDLLVNLIAEEVLAGFAEEVLDNATS